MGTYDQKQVLLDYFNDRMKIETAMGHSLQHIDKLYEAQTAANVRRQELRNEVKTLKEEVKTLHIEVDRLTTLLEQFLAKQ